MSTSTRNTETAASNSAADAAMFAEYQAFLAWKAQINALEDPNVVLSQAVPEPIAPPKPAMYVPNVTEGDTVELNGVFMLVSGVNNPDRKNKRITVEIETGVASDREQRGKSWVSGRVSAEVADMLFGKFDSVAVAQPAAPVLQQAPAPTSKPKAAKADKPEIDWTQAIEQALKNPAIDGDVIGVGHNHKFNVYIWVVTEGGQDQRYHVIPETGEIRSPKGKPANTPYDCNASTNMAKWAELEKYYVDIL